MDAREREGGAFKSGLASLPIRSDRRNLCGAAFGRMRLRNILGYVTGLDPPSTSGARFPELPSIRQDVNYVTSIDLGK
jgi:hypothetical protein